MNKQIKMCYKGKEYVLEYTRKTVKTMEDRGFSISALTEKPMTMWPLLFSGAFMANHRRVDHALVEEMFDKIPNKDQLMDKLLGMYAEPLNALLESSEDGEKENAVWTEI